MVGVTCLDAADIVTVYTAPMDVTTVCWMEAPFCTRATYWPPFGTVTPPKAVAPDFTRYTPAEELYPVPLLQVHPGGQMAEYFDTKG